MLRTIIISSTLAVCSAVNALASDLITKTSPHSVAVTTDRLEAAALGAGATVFARVDHAGGADRVGLDLRPTQLLIFGNPKLGTPAMRDAQTAGLDLPLRVLVYEDADGMVHLAYHSPASLADQHGLPQGAKYIQMMTGALDKLTAKAAAAD